MTEENIFSYPEFVRSLFKQDTLPMMYIHAAMGIAGEVAELLESEHSTPAHQVEELGDLYFYCQAALNLSHDNLMHHIGQKPEVDAPWTALAGSILDTVKRYAIYGKPLDESAFRRDVQSLARVILRFTEDLEYTPQHIIRSNVAKLRKRYPAGTYSDADAIARADKNADSPIAT